MKVFVNTWCIKRKAKQKLTSFVIISIEDRRYSCKNSVLRVPLKILWRGFIGCETLVWFIINASTLQSKSLIMKRSSNFICMMVQYQCAPRCIDIIELLNGLNCQCKLLRRLQIYISKRFDDGIYCEKAQCSQQDERKRLSFLRLKKYTFYFPPLFSFCIVPYSPIILVTSYNLFDFIYNLKWCDYKEHMQNKSWK